MASIHLLGVSNPSKILPGGVFWVQRRGQHAAGFSSFGPIFSHHGHTYLLQLWLNYIGLGGSK